jgi:ABC-type polar amino acid transport system ATPase subunit
MAEGKQVRFKVGPHAMNRLLKFFKLDPESKDCVVICGPINAGKRSILVCLSLKILSLS